MQHMYPEIHLSSSNDGKCTVTIKMPTEFDYSNEIIGVFNYNPFKPDSYMSVFVETAYGLCGVAYTPAQKEFLVDVAPGSSLTYQSEYPSARLSKEDNVIAEFALSTEFLEFTHHG